MLHQKVNIRSFTENCSDLLELVANGDEIIITKSNVPIAKVTPISASSINISDNFITVGTLKQERARKNEASENWFG